MNSFIFEVTGDFDISVLCCEVFFSARVYFTFFNQNQKWVCLGKLNAHWVSKNTLTILQKRMNFIDYKTLAYKSSFCFPLICIA